MRGVSDQIVLGAACTGPPGSAAVAGGSHHTVLAAAEVLASGGNSVDAAIAGMCAAAVAEPVLTSPGGGGFLLHAPLHHEPTYLDFFVNIPGLGAHPHARKAEITSVPITFGALDNPQAQQIFHAGWAAVAVPGALAGYLKAHQRWGRLQLRDVLRPACRMASAGLRLELAQQDFLRLVIDVLCLTPASAELYRQALTNGHFANPQYAALLERLSHDSAEAMTEWNDLLVAEMAVHGGLVTAEDLTHYNAIAREPVLTSRGGHRVWTNPPPSFGGTIVRDALAQIPISSSVDWVAVTQSLRDATSRQRARDINDGATQVSRGTTHITVVDSDGCMVACTTSNGSSSGTQVSGVQLNNMLGEDDLIPSGLQSLSAGQRMGSMMTPTLVDHADGTRIAFGTGGSERIRSATVCTLINLLDLDMPLPQSIAQGRVHASQTSIDIEPPIDPMPFATAEADGLELRVWPSQDLFFGGVHAVSRAPDGSLHAVGDARRGGTAAIIRPGP